MAETEVMATRIPHEHAESIRQIAQLRRTTVSDVVSRIIVESVAPGPTGPATDDH
jgi:hypothetical protein